MAVRLGAWRGIHSAGGAHSHTHTRSLTRARAPESTPAAHSAPIPDSASGDRGILHAPAYLYVSVCAVLCEHSQSERSQGTEVE